MLGHDRRSCLCYSCCNERVAAAIAAQIARGVGPPVGPGAIPMTSGQRWLNDDDRYVTQPTASLVLRAIATTAKLETTDEATPIQPQRQRWWKRWWRRKK